jgi:hypothetical protein
VLPNDLVTKVMEQVSDSTLLCRLQGCHIVSATQGGSRASHLGFFIQCHHTSFSVQRNPSKPYPLLVLAFVSALGGRGADTECSSPPFTILSFK